MGSNTANAYREHGYKDRGDYLAGTAERFGADPYVVSCLADVLGEGEDFYGLICELEDLAYARMI